MTGQDENAESAADGLVDRLAVIEDQPLESRAASYAELQERLRARLEGADSPR
ncbi:hypothetical protein SAMN06295885_1836 [Rathayibacter oskolensis]|uniref:Uncharacterized protein n=1 Tax=Rathayibacter oskolensis TaxID=1891671 RepID=A0A1X7NTP0_9MICO|nr:hypothetical protein SAMN06295885_1836 [Rathayibacter oskolensis]